MSRLANKPISIPQGVEIKVDGHKVIVKGKRGELTREFFDYIILELENNSLWVKPPKINSTDETAIKENRAKYSAQLGLVWKLVSNMIEGVTTGYKKVLQLEGTGYRSNVQGDTITLQLGFSSDVKMKIPEGVQVTVEKDTKIIIEGNDKEQVGELAMNIKKKRPVEPYKGKGVRFEGEYIKYKESKKAAK
ncbi:50S ribosomal protein L6 [Brachyspira sp.]|uniref:50S ribosomal protein L6 n=1 Tax=Brachyspira sp. TaxID=1977261 RepID=UPI0026070C67|nr:50S ribosomal protein L6 [Brachyspira sp.]